MHSPSDVAQAWQTLAQTEEGRLVLSDLARKYGFQTISTYDPCPSAMAFKEGGRAVMVYVGRMLAADPQILLEREHS